jgi:hypothetical protein
VELVVVTILVHPIIHAQGIARNEGAIEEVARVHEDVVAQQAIAIEVQQTKDVILL